ncbi:MAG: sigma-70 family RNA polymerase sigma factor [Lachnospiraceae bacterium]|nr:sigma-70 family RNA polymerase sigma factor [Lachnospiraceae bacterium]
MDETEYSRILQHYSDMVYRLAFSYLKNKEDAEDIYQNVFLKLLSTKKTFSDREYEKRWLIRITINECHSLYRSPWRKHRQICENLHLLLEKQQIAKPWKDAEALFLQDEENVTALLKNIPEKYSIVLYLFYFEEYSTKEIADLLKRKESTIRTQLQRGRELLRKNILESAKY